MKPKIAMIAPGAFIESIATAIGRAGGVPVLLPIHLGADLAEGYIDMVDGLLVPGGLDVTPAIYGQDPRPQVTYSRQEQDEFELALIRAAMAQKKPIFGICRGLQILNVALGGTLLQDVATQGKKQVAHTQELSNKAELFHTVEFVEGSLMAAIHGAEKMEVNSLHHQGIDTLAPGLRATALAKDGLIEGIETEDGLVYGVQWHPECLYERYPHFQSIFNHFVEQCK